MTKTIRVGFAGAGYIAAWHAEAIAATPGVRLVAVADPARAAAEALAGAYGAAAFDSLAAMLASGQCDAVHVLTPPHLHCEQALACLAAGVHVLVEKPFALTRAEAEAMVAAAAAAGRQIAVNHNFLGLPSYARLKRHIAAGDLGRIDSADIHWRFPLSPIRSGPFGLWMLRSRDNLLTEFAPHLFAFATDLFGPVEPVSVHLSKPMAQPGAGDLPQSWRILARAGSVDLSLSLSLVEGTDDRSLSLRGVAGSARIDFGADTLVMNRANASDIVINPLRHEIGQAAQHLREGTVNAARQLVSLNRKSPYALGFRTALAGFHGAIAENRPVDTRFGGASALPVVAAIADTLALLPPVASMPAVPADPAPAPQMLVIGGTGFIGRVLTRALVAKGLSVRVISRGRANPFADLGDWVQIVPAALDDGAALQAAMDGITCVYHLARANETSWDGFVRNDVAVTETIARAALAAGVGRMVYTGTIASYDASDPARTIDETTPFGPMEARNLYARSKALCEDRLMAMHRSHGLPLVIARPGIVLGAGGPLQHWGIGRWHGAGAVRIWGTGRNRLPFVLVDDVADGLIAMATAPGLEGRSFNLVGDPMMTARDYFAAIHRLTGTRIRVAAGSLNAFYAGDMVKYALKRFVLRKPGLTVPSRVDWVSRAHLSPFSNAAAKADLGWKPEADANRFAQAAIGDISLFGF